MQYVSAQYKADMKAARRGKSLMRISIGLINQQAQQNAAIEGDDFTYFSDLTTPFDDEAGNKVYATYEEDFSKVDGSMYFLPRKAAGKAYYYSGAVTEEIRSGNTRPAIRIEFGTPDPVDIKGLTINFSEYYPTRLTVITDEQSVSFDNEASVFRTEQTFNNCTYMIIRADAMVNGEGRMRLISIQFGMGITLDDNKIISADIRSTISPVAEALPSVDFSVTVENMDKYYNVDNEDSAINYMATGQEIEVYCGLKLTTEEVEWVKLGTLCMKDWESNDTTATFKAVDFFEYMQDTYKKGEYHPDGISLRNLAIAVLEDAGIGEKRYWIDPYLDRVIVNNPLPSVAHKECLQLIANAGRSVLMQGTDGRIMLKSSFIPDFDVDANAEAEYSDVHTLLTESDYQEYVSYEQDFSLVNGAMFFIPRDAAKYIKTGFISAVQADGEGDFTENPIVTINMETAYTFYNITLVFGSVQPRAFIIRTYNNGSKVATYRSKQISKKTIVTYEFIDIDKIEIEFIKAASYQRIHLNRIEFGEATDYNITYDDLMQPPDGKRLERIKRLDIVRTIYTRGTEQKDLSTEKITLPPEVCEYEVEFSNAVHDLSVATIIDEEEVDYGAEIIEAKTYYCKVRITQPPSTATEVELRIRGYEYGISTVVAPYRINNNGAIETRDNPLISSEKEAQDLAEWMGAFYESRNEYKLSYRGDPALNCNDIFYLESLYNDNLMVRAEEVSLKYSGSIRGEILARRES